MYEIDFLTCSVNDVITHSYVCHPSLLAHGFRERAKLESHYARITLSKYCREFAEKMAAECRDAQQMIEDQDFEISELSSNARIVAFRVACDSQCVSWLLSSSILDRDNINRGSR